MTSCVHILGDGYGKAGYSETSMYSGCKSYEFALESCHVLWSCTARLNIAFNW